MIAYPIDSVVIRCDYRDVTWPVVGSIYACNVAAVQNPEISEVTEIFGNHLAGRSAFNVEGFSWYGPPAVTQFPQNLNLFFVNLAAFDFTGGQMRSIAAEHLNPFPRLTVLSLTSNQIASLDGDLFQRTPRLAFLSFDSNFIRNVGNNLLANLPALTSAYFGSNPCINVVATTPQAIELLKIQLFTQCPSLPVIETTTAGSCSSRCSINDEVDELRARIEAIERSLQ